MSREWQFLKQEQAGGMKNKNQRCSRQQHFYPRGRPDIDETKQKQKPVYKFRQLVLTTI